MNKSQLEAYRIAFTMALKSFERIEVNCESCAHHGTDGGCALANGMAPPKEVLPVGCGAWEWDNIPV